MEPKKIAIIGSGSSGLAAIKCCLDEGLNPVCLERTDRVGGLWYYTEKVSEGQSCVMKTTVINTSKEIMTYSNFPIPAEFPIYMHNSKVVEYLQMYGKHFHAEKYTRFNTEVTSVKQSDKFEETGQWELTTKDHKTGTTTTEIYDGVLVCSGHHAEKQLPNFEGLDSFKGTVTHTHDYRHHVGYEGKRVVVIGIGNSGGDVAVELSRIASQVYVSTRRGTWVFNRISTNGYPGDMVGIKRVNQFITSVIPREMGINLLERGLNARFNHENYGIKPKHRATAQHPTVNDELPNRIACGSIIIKPNIKRINANSVEFEDGTVAEDIDAIILATGYKFGFPFIHHEALEVKNNRVNLYKYIFPPDIRPNTLAVIGGIQPLGALMPISEMQCRWATRVFNGTSFLPSKDEMWNDIHRKDNMMKLRYVQTERHTIQVDYLPYMDELADQFGCKPDVYKMFWHDPKLAMQCFFGPFCPYQYRLVGPGQWSGARNAIMTVWDRTLAGTGPVKSPKTATLPIYGIVLALIVGFIFLRFFISIFIY